MRFGVPLPVQYRHRTDISCWQPPSNRRRRRCRRHLYALPSRTRWSWYRGTVQHSATVHSEWLHQERGMACLPQSEPLRHCRRFVRNWIVKTFLFRSSFQWLTSTGRSSFFLHCLQRACCIFADNVKCPCNVCSWQRYSCAFLIILKIIWHTACPLLTKCELDEWST